MAVSKNKTLDAQYSERYAAGAAEFLSERGTEGTRLLRCAFDATHQPLGPFDASQPAKLAEALDALLDVSRASYAKAKSTQSFSADIVETAKQTARALHSHSGKYINPESKTLAIIPVGKEKSPYLSTESAGHVRSVTGAFAHAPVQRTPASVFLATVLINGEIRNVSELIVAGNASISAAFARAGVTTSDYELIRKVLAFAFEIDPYVDYSLPQLLWPHNGEYVGLLPIPGIPVYNAIASMRTLVDEDHYVPMSSFRVGSGKAQNISVAASNLAGHLPILTCVPPLVPHSGAKRLLARLHADQLMDPVPFTVLQRFDKDIHAVPNAPRRKILVNAARVHAATALSSAIELREAIAAEALGRAKLPSTDSALTKFVTSVPLTAADRVELRNLVLSQGPGAKAARHSNEDLDIYFNALLVEIENLETAQ